VEKGFFGSLFDLSFSSLVTTKVIKVLYVLSIVVIGLTALVFIASAFAQSAAAGLLVLVIVAPLVSFLYLIYARVFLEVIIVLFRILETNVQLVDLTRAQTAPAAPVPPPTPPAPPAPSGPEVP
jgi:hypothetical protein